MGKAYLYYYVQKTQKKWRKIQRKINKKLTHIQELEKTPKDELLPDQKDMIARKAELLKQIEENNEIKNLYLEAYSKKGEYEANLDQPAQQVEQKVEAQEVKQV